jgi:hypothetical protein
LLASIEGNESMSLSKEIEKLKHDKRLTDWYVSRGRMTKEELKSHLDSLPDLASNVEPLWFSEEEKGNGALPNGLESGH